MSSTQARILIDRGRKAGLRTDEIYQALTGRPLEARDPQNGRSDGNGYAANVDAHGKVQYGPLEERS